MYNDIRNH